MKITYENCKDLIYRPKSISWRDKNTKKYYFYHISCEWCGVPFMGRKIAKCCSRECKIENESGDLAPCYGRSGDKHPMYGKTHTSDTKRKMSGKEPWNKGKPHSKETISRISKSLTGKFKGKNNPNYGRKGIRYSTYKDMLPFYGINCRKYGKEGIEISCMYCGKWFVPDRFQLSRKLQSIKGQAGGENNIYCSEGCKYSCPTYGQKLYPKDFKPATSREVQPQLRKLVLERDNWTCQKCGSVDELHCHHIDPVVSNPIESADVDNCITYCKDCHKEAHQQDGCEYGELRNCV